MRNIFFLIFLSFSYSNFSYESLLLSYSTYDLLSGQSKYLISKNISFNQKIKKNIASSLIILPQDLTISSFNHTTNFLSDYSNFFNFNIVDYGEFQDSESQTTFYAKDIILENNIFKKINNSLHLGLGVKYLNSHIEDYVSTIITMNASSYYQYHNILFSTTIDNYGLIFDKYTNYTEELPTNYSLSLMYLPQYLHSSISIHYNMFDYYDVINIFGELFIKDYSSITIGYTSLADNFYSDNFNKNFFTGFSIGYNLTYQDYMFNIGVKNFGILGLIQAITINKSVN